MSYFPAICTQCGATVEVENNCKTMICHYCGTSFVVKKNDDTTIKKDEMMQPDTINLGGIELTKVQGDAIINLLNKRKKIKAVKKLQDIKGIGLKEATEAINEYEKELYMLNNAGVDDNFTDLITENRFARIIRFLIKWF